MPRCKTICSPATNCLTTCPSGECSSKFADACARRAGLTACVVKAIAWHELGRQLAAVIGGIFRRWGTEPRKRLRRRTENAESAAALGNRCADPECEWKCKPRDDCPAPTCRMQSDFSAAPLCKWGFSFCCPDQLIYNPLLKDVRISSGTNPEISTSYFHISVA